ncbi:hypothetical protein [Streptomyces ortus]|uniref:Uncharacterized protein n=1 Tax=Streptomyces ortus TaxID=2867268 RepID=A0ABT3V3P5_9ACTN|nr:hypothetical protein [Streptomyces ortus]MCX4233265.1 hypothetical protein [Streptomyces ortus]
MRTTIIVLHLWLLLASAVLTQRGATTVKRLELEYAERQRAAERRAEEHCQALEVRRTCYIKVHQVIRHYEAMLYSHMRMPWVGARPPPSAVLEAARCSVRDAYAEALIGVPDGVVHVGGGSGGGPS